MISPKKTLKTTALLRRIIVFIDYPDVNTST